MLLEKNLLEMRDRLTEEVIDDSEELIEWAIESGPDLINEVLLYRKVLKRLFDNLHLDPEGNARLAGLALEAAERGTYCIDNAQW